MFSCPEDNDIPPVIRSVGFVCTGNICRSPMAEAVLRSLVAKEADFETVSLGTLARQGNPAMEGTIIAAREAGLDLGGHRATPASPPLLAGLDLVFTMERHHMEDILIMAPELRAKMFSLGCFSSRDPGPAREIADPYGGPLTAYRECLVDIRDCVGNLYNFLLPRLVRQSP